MYNDIDKMSNLMWTHKDEIQFIQRRDIKSKTRSCISNEDKEKSHKWEKETDA